MAALSGRGAYQEREGVRGMAVLREVAVRKMWNSVTTFEDVTRVTGKKRKA